MTIFEKAKSLIDRRIVEHFCKSEKAKWKGNEYWTLNPLRNDKKIGSYSINDKGYYKDFADDSNGDLINLICEKNNCKKKEAAQIILDFYGVKFDSKEKYTPPIQKKSVKKELPGNYVEPITPIPKTEQGSLSDFLYNTEWLINPKDDCEYEFKFIVAVKDEKARSLFVVARYEQKEKPEPGEKTKKRIIPVYLSKKGWIARKPISLLPFPAIGAHKLKKNKKPVLIVEGEKCYNIDVNGFNLVTFTGGVKRIDETDWTPFKKRNCIMWPDKDDNEQGHIAALYIKKTYLPKLEILDVHKYFENEKSGYDIFDAIHDGLKPEQVISECDRYYGVLPIEPYHAYKLFLYDLFSDNDLMKISGTYWRYKKDRFYWEIMSYSDLKSSVQLWMEKKGYMNFLIDESKSINTFKTNLISFVDTHGTENNIINYNPFKESAIKPYVHFNNGIIEMSDYGFEFKKRPEDIHLFKSLYPLNCFDYDYKIDEKINYGNLEEYAPLFYKYIKDLIPEKYIDDSSEFFNTFIFACQIIAYSMSALKPGEYFFGFYGDQGTGKSSLYKLASSFIGDEFVVYRSVSDIVNNRFGTSDLWGKKIFVDDDVSDGQYLPDGFIKKNSGNKTITMEQKNKDAVHGVKIAITMFFISNFEFKVSGNEGIRRRAIFVNFKNKIKDQDDYIINRLTGKMPHIDYKNGKTLDTYDERPFIIPLIMKAWEVFTKNKNKFTVPKWIQGPAKDMITNSTSVGSYIQAIIYNEYNGILTGTKYSLTVVYEGYREWCKDEGRKPRQKGKFTEELKRNDEFFTYTTKPSREYEFKRLKREDNGNVDNEDYLHFAGE